MDDVGWLRARDNVDRFEAKMKVAEQSCSPFKVAEVAEVATCRKCLKTNENRCNFKVARSKLLQSPPL